MNPQNLHAHEDRLLDFVYGELPVPEARAVEAHLQGCARCTQALDDIRGVRATMSQLSSESAPDAGLESLLAYAQQSARRAAAGPAPRPSRWRRWLLPVVGLASVSTFGILAIQQRNPDLTRPNLSMAAAEPELARKAESAPARQEPRPMAPAPALQGAPMQEAPAEVASALVAGDEAPRRAEGWEKEGSGGGLDARLVRENESKAKRDFGSSKERARSVSDKAATMKPAPGKKMALFQKDLDEEDALSAPEGRVADSQAPKLVPPRDSLRLGGTSPAYGGVADDGEPAQAEEAEPESLAAQSQAGALGYAAAGPATAAPPPPAPVVAAAPMPTAPSAGRGAASVQEALAERSDSNAEQDFSTAKRKKGEAVSAPTRAPTSRPQVAAAEPRPSVAELSRRAREAFDDGDRAMEAGLLRSALAAGATGTERLGLLNRLCDAELFLGRQAAGVAACNQILTEAPGSSAAQAARRRLSREPTSLEAPAKSAAPGK
ncbi:anti-sigma factor family protein [Pyxidicoccus trucidator]|uniref:anti-sigma factor family protein n=1 Tax=Pyxidicoccus trucidator TaxID=2709662 RepID=UPI0013DA9033|nr:zf-HC2 domain-containing protein [Pyxidicoccus trucidator]